MRRRVTTAVLFLLVMGLVDAAIAQTPEATPAPPFAPWQVTDVREIEVDGDLVALSPDAQLIAGIGADGGSICVWEVERLTSTCAGEGLRIQTQPLTGSITWAPDSSAVAFINGITQLLEPTDVMVFDLDSGELTNITDTAMTGEVLVHTGPGWTSDSETIVFAQTNPAASDDAPAEIIYFDRITGEAEPVPFDDDFSIYTPIVMMPDDSVVFRVDLVPGGGENAGIWRVEPDGSNLNQVLAGGDSPPIDSPVILGVSRNGEYLSVASATAITRSAPDEAFFMVDTESGDVTAVDLGDDGEVVGQPVVSPVDLFALVQDGTGIGVSMVVMDLETHDVQPLEGVDMSEPWILRPPTWAAGEVVLIPASGGGTLVTLKQETETAPLE